VCGVDIADQDCASRIRMPAVHDCSGIDGNDVAVLQDTIRGDPVDYLVVDGGTDGGRKTVVAEKIRGSAVLGQNIAEDLIKLVGRDTGLCCCNDGVESLMQNQPGLVHDRHLGICFQFNTTSHVLRLPLSSRRHTVINGCDLNVANC